MGSFAFETSRGAAARNNQTAGKAIYHLCLLAALLCLALPLSAQPAAPTQTVRGTVLDADSKAPLTGVNVTIQGSEPLIGAVTGPDGEFRLPNVPVGRIGLNLSYLGYRPRSIPNVVVNAGKETVLQLELAEAATDLAEAVVTASQSRGEPLSEMAQISARSISMEEMNRLAASFNDPALITSNFAGVATTGDGGNDIIVRGNSPKYLQWRLEGVPITNPNHFADQNAVLGATSALNANLLATSDFYTGAFPAEYGNALSGVYDIRLRNGNNEKFEGIAGIGLLGTELTLEGPLKQGYGGSFLANYRYSTASILNSAGLLDVKGKPAFQDAAFKLYLPTEKYGVFSAFGLGGHSTFSLDDVTFEDWNTPGDDIMSGEIFEAYDKATYLFNTGVNHSIQLDGRSYLRSSISFSAEGIDDDVRQRTDSLGTGTPSFVSELRRTAYRASTSYHRKFNARNTVQAGAVYTLFGQRAGQARRSAADAGLQTALDFDERLGNLRTFVSWKHRWNGALTMVAGLHNHNVFFNGEHTVEPRLSARWQMTPKGALSFGYGLHSTMESVHHYFASVEQPDGSFGRPNLNLGLLKAHHFVLGYDYRATPNLLARVEAYYQRLYNLPVEDDPGSYFSTINEGAELDYVALVNEGTGRNYGIELSLQRFFADGYYFLFNTSIYESTYKTLEGVERNTRFNGNYIVNAIAGKEFTNLGKKRNKTLGVNARFLLSGGQRIIPLLRDVGGNLAVDPANGRYWDYGRAYEDRLDNLYQLTLSASYKIERRSTTHELFLNLENITGNQGRLTEYYDAGAEGGVGYTTQFGLLPNLMYRVYF
ncbi:MAG: TonB-dependent receptor [Phaeodactylibacter sp.]|nr:TonB-dependent receptor [Phaeodactylibacter sp.]